MINYSWLSQLIALRNLTNPTNNELNFQLESIDIIVVDEYKLLGMIFEKKTVLYSTVLQLLHVVVHTNWRVDRQTTLTVQNTHSIPNRLQKFYLVINKKNLPQKTESHLSLWPEISTWIIQNFSVENCYAEANKTPPNLKYNKLALQYYTKLEAAWSVRAVEYTNCISAEG